MHIKNKECTLSNWSVISNFFDRGQFYITTFDDFVCKQEQVIKEICNFLGLKEQEGMQYVLQSNKSSEARSVALKNLIKKPSMIKKIAKWLLPSFAIRQKLRNYVQSLNNKSIDKKPFLKLIVKIVTKDISNKKFNLWKIYYL